MSESYDIIVIGGGPSGMMAAGRAGELGARVLLIEKNNRLGKKLSITGGRRCNITNAEFDPRLFLENFTEAKQFLYSPFSQFDVQATFDFFEGHGLPLAIEDRKRAFPKTRQAEDVCRVLEKYVLESGNVKVHLNTSVKSLVKKGDDLTGVKTDKGVYHAKKIILATGGLAAPETGSTGDGISMLASIGHNVKEPDPDLAPLKTSATWVHDLSGVSVDDMCLRYVQEKKTKLKIRGRVLFTHFGISGPIVINSAHEVKKLLANGKLDASVDLFPDHDLGSLDGYLVKLFEERKNKKLKTVMKELMQKKIAEKVFSLFGESVADTKVHSITKEQRKRLVGLLKDLRFPIVGTMGYEWSIVADGGVVPEEVDFRSMTSRLYPNLYLVGDTININRPSGGFSLQLCWTTGFVAGTHGASTD
jgi:predicted Rossmann fold flavoprotein